MMRRRVFLAGVPLLLCAARDVPAARAISRMDLKWWRERHESVLHRLRNGPVDLLLIGDSITHDLQRTGPIPELDYSAVWNRFYAPRNAVNLGFSGDTTASVIWRIRNGEVDGITPKAVQILIGANNFGAPRWSAEDSFEGIEVILAELRQRLPHAKIILLGILPSGRSPWVTDQTKTLNRMLADRHRGAGHVSFIDASPIYMKHGVVDADAFYDSLAQPKRPALHPTAQSWMRMAEMVEPTLSALMGDRPR